MLRVLNNETEDPDLAKDPRLLNDVREVFAKDRPPGHQGLFADTPDPPPSPAMFQPDPVIAGSPEFARMATTLANLDPRIKAGVHRVTQGPGYSGIKALTDMGLSPDWLGPQGLEGAYAHGDISVKPWGPSSDIRDPNSTGVLDTLIHEFSHASGKDEESAMAAGGLAEKYRYLREAEGKSRKRSTP